MKRLHLLFLVSFILMPLAAKGNAPMSTAPNAHQFEFESLDGDQIKLEDFKGQVLLVVNTASQCGFTPQYAGLQKIHETYSEKGLVVLAVPSPDFGGQEFETETEVQNFTDEKFSVTFPRTSIYSVKGENAHPFYKWANEKAGFIGSPKWNFHKYLIDANGNFVSWYASTTNPTAGKLINTIEAELAKIEK